MKHVPVANLPADREQCLPKGWSYNPSAWRERLPLLALAVVGLLAALYTALAQLGAVPAMWDPFFGSASRTNKRAAQHAFTQFYQPLVRLLTLRTYSKQRYNPSEISPFFTVNGEPPHSPEYLKLLWLDFETYTLEVTGLVEQPLNQYVGRPLCHVHPFLDIHVLRHGELAFHRVRLRWRPPRFQSLARRLAPASIAEVGPHASPDTPS